MKTLLRHLRIVRCGTLTGALLVTIAGCETQSTNSPVTITPASILVHKGDVITFTADGGFDYSWELSDHLYGVLSNTRGRQTTYTVINEPVDNDINVVLTVTSTINGAAPREEGVTYDVQQEAYIRIASATGGAAADVLKLSPTSVSLGPSGTQVFTASGGSGTYTWATAQGTVSPSTGNQVTYTAPNYSTNAPPAFPDGVTVTDSDSNTAFATVNLK